MKASEKMGLFALMIAGGLMSMCANAEQTIYQRIAEQGHIAPTQSIDAAYKTTTNMRFRTINYTDMVCTDAGYSIIANLITSGVPVYGDDLDNQWLEKQKSVKNCWQQPPNQAFKTTDAIAIYTGEMGVTWVVGVVVPASGKIAGFIPLDDIQFIPIPTL